MALQTQVNDDNLPDKIEFPNGSVWIELLDTIAPSNDDISIMGLTSCRHSAFVLAPHVNEVHLHINGSETRFRTLTADMPPIHSDEDVGGGRKKGVMNIQQASSQTYSYAKHSIQLTI